MYPRYLIFFFLLIICPHTQANYLALTKRAANIDSLTIRYSDNYHQAMNEANSLYQLLLKKPTTKEYLDLRIKVMLQIAILKSLNGDHDQSLRISLQAHDMAETYALPEKLFHSSWIVALMYEIGGQLDLCKKYLDKASLVHQQHRLDHLYSSYCIRISSYYKHKKDTKSSIYYAYKGLKYARRYHNKRDLRDAHLLLGLTLPPHQSLKHRLIVAENFKEIRDYSSAAIQFNNIAFIYQLQKKIPEAFMYSDSALSVTRGRKVYVYPKIYLLRSQLFDSLGHTDSAYYYFRKYHFTNSMDQNKMETSKIRQISEKYQNDKKEAIITSKNKQMILIISLLLVITFSTLLVIRKNRKIRSQNKIITAQVEELVKTLDQKQILLSELQHRVKNNLQHVISILEIQKESVDFNNISELIRGNQNRIHSMALLHKKLNISEHVNEIDLGKYINELSELVRDSYNDPKKQIRLITNCEIERMSIEKALPIGLIIVELVSNSMKYAFKDREIGIIQIGIKIGLNSEKNRFFYSDNGIGFNFHEVAGKGLGLEIIKGLIDQLNGTTESTGKKGFELTIAF